MLNANIVGQEDPEGRWGRGDEDEQRDEDDRGAAEGADEAEGDAKVRAEDRGRLKKMTESFMEVQASAQLQQLQNDFLKSKVDELKSMLSEVKDCMTKFPTAVREPERLARGEQWWFHEPHPGRRNPQEGRRSAWRPRAGGV